jgi:hypothetical protein
MRANAVAWRTKPYKKLRRDWLARLIALFASAVIGALFWLAPFGVYLETNFGRNYAPRIGNLFRKTP